MAPKRHLTENRWQRWEIQTPFKALLIDGMKTGGRAKTCNVHQSMKDERVISTAQACGAHVASNAASVQPLYQQIKLALDVQPGDLMVVRMVDGANPQPAQ